MKGSAKLFGSSPLGPSCEPQFATAGSQMWHANGTTRSLISEGHDAIRVADVHQSRSSRGGRGIRTLEVSPPSGFQDRRTRPLCEPSRCGSSVPDAVVPAVTTALADSRLGRCSSVSVGPPSAPNPLKPTIDPTTAEPMPRPSVAHLAARPAGSARGWARAGARGHSRGGPATGPGSPLSRGAPWPRRPAIRRCGTTSCDLVPRARPRSPGPARCRPRCPSPQRGSPWTGRPGGGRRRPP